MINGNSKRYQYILSSTVLIECIHIFNDFMHVSKETKNGPNCIQITAVINMLTVVPLS